LLGGTAVAPAGAEPRPLPRADQALVDRAIDRGVAFLRKNQGRKGAWDSGGDLKYRLGYTLLPGLALREAGVPADDLALRKVATLTRAAWRSLDATYDLALAVLFLDRLGDPADEKLIEGLALRLVAGQCRCGGWCYRCPTMSPAKEKELREVLDQVRRHDEAGGGGPSPRVPDALRVLTVFRDASRIPPWDAEKEVGDYYRPIAGDADNSNTQFALLALWVARRHGVPVDRTLRLAVRHLEGGQNPDGTWNYRTRPGGGPWEPGRSRAAMTAVGLLGLAVREGLAEPAAGAAPDPKVLVGLATLSTAVGEPLGQMPRPVPPRDYYFLWSLERVAMLYDLPTVGGKDWYRWGAEVLVSNQADSGEWPGGAVSRADFCASYGPTVNTSFALLFLKRSHLAPDLTAKIPFKARDLNEGVAGVLRKMEAPFGPGGPGGPGFPAGSTGSPGSTSKKPELSTPDLPRKPR
jgi:hypothetical protein